jgi:ATP-dependent DNA ligase
LSAVPPGAPNPRQIGPERYASQDSVQLAACSSRIHWVEPKLVTEITYLTWTGDGLLRHTVYVGLREDKPADQVRRER